MLYSNIRRGADDTFLKSAKLLGITVGTGTIFLPVPDNFPPNLPAREVICGFSVGQGSGGFPRITRENGALYLFLDCVGESVKGLAQAPYRLMSFLRAKTGGVVTGTTTIFKAKDGDVFLVKEFGEIESVLYFVSKNTVHHCKFPLAEKMFEDLGRKPPFTLIEGRFNPKEWRNLAP